VSLESPSARLDYLRRVIAFAGGFDFIEVRGSDRIRFGQAEGDDELARNKRLAFVVRIPLR